MPGPPRGTRYRSRQQAVSLAISGMYHQGATIREIAAQLQISKSSVHNALRRTATIMRARGAKKHRPLTRCLWCRKPVEHRFFCGTTCRRASDHTSHAAMRAYFLRAHGSPWKEIGSLLGKSQAAVSMAAKGYARYARMPWPPQTG